MRKYVALVAIVRPGRGALCHLPTASVAGPIGCTGGTGVVGTVLFVALGYLVKVSWRRNYAGGEEDFQGERLRDISISHGVVGGKKYMRLLAIALCSYNPEA